MKDEENNLTEQFDTAARTSSTCRTIHPSIFLFLPLLWAATIAMRACRPLTGGIDFWAHAAIGRWILEQNRVPEQTLFLWGREPIAWVAHSWGAQTIFALVMRGGETWGPRLAIALTMVLSVLAFVPLWNLWRKQIAPHFFEKSQHPASKLLLCLTTAIVTSIAIYAAAPRFKPRPELFSAVLLSLLLVILLERRRTSSTCTARDYAVWWLVPLFALWANLHGAWAFGLVLLAIVVACDGVQFRADVAWRPLFLVAIACALATLLNPYGAQLWSALGAVRSSTFELIEEWKSPWEAPLLPVGYFVAECVLVLSAGAVWLGNPRRQWSDMGWLFFAFASFLGARRHLWFLALVCLALWAVHAPATMNRWGQSVRFQRYQRFLSTSRPRVLAQSGIWCVMVWALALATPRDFLMMRALHRETPVQMMKWLRAHPAPGRVWNDYEWSSYAQWALAGNPPLYIDLLNAYPDALMLEYFDVLALKPNGLQVLAEVNTVMSRPAKAPEQLKRMQKYFDARPNTWRRVYRGVDGTIWRRRQVLAEPLETAEPDVMR